jgi:Fe2+ or Zn2+ uptake regulation protein
MTQNRSAEPADRAADILRQHGLRVTRQRKAIWRVLTATEGQHLSADEVFRRALHDQPELSRATVYNALGELVSAGLVGLVDAPDRQLYDTNVDPHHHFRCRRCGLLYDIEPSGVERVRVSEHAFAVERIRVLVEGVCAGCAA